MKADGSGPCVDTGGTTRMNNGDAALTRLTLGDDGGLRNNASPDVGMKEFMIFPGVLTPAVGCVCGKGGRCIASHASTHHSLLFIPHLNGQK